MSEGPTASATGPGQAQTRTVHYLRPGLTSITPYVVVRGGVQFIAFLKAAFEGTERLRMRRRTARSCTRKWRSATAPSS